MYTHLAKGGQLLTATRKRLLASTTMSLYLLAQPQFLPSRIVLLRLLRSPAFQSIQ